MQITMDDSCSTSARNWIDCISQVVDVDNHEHCSIMYYHKKQLSSVNCIRDVATLMHNTQTLNMGLSH